MKSLQSHFKTQEYARLRIGVGSPKHNLVDHVQGEFSKQEKQDLDILIAEAAAVVEHWIREDSIEIVMTHVNAPKTT